MKTDMGIDTYIVTETHTETISVTYTDMGQTIERDKGNRSNIDNWDIKKGRSSAVRG